MDWFLGILMLSILLAAVLFGARPLARHMRAKQAERAMNLFRLRREQLEAKFFDLASQRGKPRGVRWKACDWQNHVRFARDIQSGIITAFVSVHVSFEAITGSDMEDVEHVGLLRDGCAVFHYQNGNWGTGGRVLFNMNPSDAVEKLDSQYEELEERRSSPPA